MKKRIDLSGMTFGRLVVRSYTGNDKHKNAMWLCLCSCGAEKIINGSSLRSGNTNSCGCLHKELASSQTTERLTTHGMHNTPTYYSWTNMKTRCNNANFEQSKDYSGRGIAICDKWKTFAGFFADMGVKPVGTSLDRIDNNKGYSKDNCRWATVNEQANNKRNTVMWEGKSLYEWQQETGMNYYTMYSRIKRYGSLFPEHLTKE